MERCPLSCAKHSSAFKRAAPVPAAALPAAWAAWPVFIFIIYYYLLLFVCLFGNIYIYIYLYICLLLLLSLLLLLLLLVLYGGVPAAWAAWLPCCEVRPQPKPRTPQPDFSHDCTSRLPGRRELMHRSREACYLGCHYVNPQSPCNSLYPLVSSYTSLKPSSKPLKLLSLLCPLNPLYSSITPVPRCSPLSQT